MSFGKRRKMGRGESRRDFSKKADRIHPKNYLSSVGSHAVIMRGGIRL